MVFAKISMNYHVLFILPITDTILKTDQNESESRTSCSVKKLNRKPRETWKSTNVKDCLDWKTEKVKRLKSEKVKFLDILVISS